MATGDRHPAEAEYLRFLARPDQPSAYVKRCAAWVKATYPGSVATLIPRMRDLYTQKTRDGQ